MKEYENLETLINENNIDELGEDIFLVNIHLSEETINKILDLIMINKDPDIGMSSVLNKSIEYYYNTMENVNKAANNKSIDENKEEKYEEFASWSDGDVEPEGTTVKEFHINDLVQKAMGKNKENIESPKDNMKNSAAKVNEKNNIQAPKDNIEISLVTANEKDNNQFDNEVNLNAKFEDMRMSLIKEYLYDTKDPLYGESSKLSKEELLKELNMIDDELKPKNIGLLMFSDRPENFIPGCQLEVVHFLGTTCDGFIEKIFHGPINEQIRAALSYIENDLIKSRNIGGNVVFNYPLEAIKEAIINAFYHRDYTQNTPIEVRIDKEKIVIISYPGPYEFIKKEDINKGEVIARKYRNKRIDECLRKLNLSTGRATGLSKIIKAMNLNGSSESIFETDDTRAYFMVKLYVNSCFLGEKEKDISLNKTEDKILALLADEPLSKKELSEYLGYENVTGNLKRSLCRLIEQKLITYTIPGNIRSKNQKYKLM